MEIVIKIPEWKYKSICEGVEASKRCGISTMNPNIDEAIYKGIPLPKGHGDLVDADAILEDPIGDTYKDLEVAEAIILADTESEEEE